MSQSAKVVQLRKIKNDDGKRRRVPRRDFSHKIGLLVRGQFSISRVLQIGEGGMMIHSPVELIVGQKVVITFRLPNLTPEIVTAEVKYVLPGDAKQTARYGVEFVNLDFKVRRDVRSYVASQTVVTEQPIM